MLSRAHVLVTDGNERAALAVTRGLGQVGIPVIVGAENETSLAGASRYCAGKWRYPSPLADPQNFISSMKQAIQVHRPSCIIAVTDSATQGLAARKEDLGPVASTIPSLHVYDAVSDKYQLMQLAQQLDVPIPETVFVPGGNISAVADQIPQYPVVIKPGRSLLQVDGKWIKTSVHFISTRAELIELYHRTPYLQHPSLIQQRIGGNGEGIFGLFDHGRPCALFAHRRIREKPPAGGLSVFRESIALPKPMTDYALRLLEHVKWHGVAMVEFKVDGQCGTPKLMEINGRFWGSLQLAIDSGLNFPYLLYQMTRGKHVAVPDNSYRVGTKSRWLLGDLDHLLLRLVKSRSQLNLDSTAPSRWRCMFDFCKLFQCDLHYEVERLNDPGPALVEYRAWLGQLIGSQI